MSINSEFMSILVILFVLADSAVSTADNRELITILIKRATALLENIFTHLKMDSLLQEEEVV